MLPATCDLLALFLLSAASLAFEVNLTRLFSVAQFYHFAFMTVSLALLGFGASGTFLSLAGGRIRHPERALTLLAWIFALTAVGSYGLTQALPFDSFRVALDPRQWGILALHYVALSLPFFCAGAATGLLLSLQRGAVGRTYAANLAGSGLGCLLAVVLPSRTGAEGMVLLTAGLGGLSALLFSRPRWPGTLLQLAVAGGLFLTAFHLPPVLEIRLSPYKGLSYALLYPDSRLLFRAWNGISRVDVVESSLIRSLPGQGIACRGQPPPQRALFVDGDDLSPITHVTDPAELAPLTDCLLTALPYRLRPEARALVLDPRGGWDLWVALAEGARSVTAVEPNPLVVAAVRAQGAWAGNLYDRPDVALFVEDGRAFLARAGPEYDVILMALPAPYHPVTSGAYSLAENYRYTVEGFVAAMRRLTDGGLFGVVRWTQSPPSEEVRAFALAVEAVERTGGDPARSLVALRSYNQVLILARRGPFTAPELAAIRQFAAARSLDLVYAPDIRPEEANRYNVMPTPEHYLAFVGLMEAEDRARWLAAYPFDVAPPTDDRPFFGHFFRWRQVPEVLAMAGHIWQPFGGAGYLVPLALLGIAVVAAAGLILLPLAGRWNGIYPVQDGMNPVLQDRINPALQDRAGEWNGIYPVQDGMNPGLRGRINPALQGRINPALRLAPFGFLGLGFMLVEIPLLQRFILFLGHPAYAMAGVLGALLLFSGLGSLLSARVPPRRALEGVVGVVVLYGLGMPLLSGSLLGLPFWARAAITGLGLAPLGVAMGMPFPRLLGALQEREPALVPWAWGVNGALSVVASVLAALMALSWGFRAVLLAGAVAYLGARLTSAWAWGSPASGAAEPPPR
jgi:spermidine synthase